MTRKDERVVLPGPPDERQVPGTFCPPGNDDAPRPTAPEGNDPMNLSDLLWSS